MLHTVAHKAFGIEYNLYSGRLAVEKAKKENGAIAVFGHGWGGELPLPKRQGKGSYYVDWILARLDKAGDLAEFAAIEVQTIDTTGSYQNARRALIEEHRIEKDSVEYLKDLAEKKNFLVSPLSRLLYILWGMII